MVNIDTTENIYLEKGVIFYVEDVVIIHNYGYVPAYVSTNEFSVDNNGIRVDKGENLSFIVPKNLFIRAWEDTVVVVGKGEAGSADVASTLTADEKADIVLGANFGEGDCRLLHINEDGSIEAKDHLLNVIEYEDDELTDDDIADMFGQDSVEAYDIAPNIVEKEGDSFTILEAWAYLDSLDGATVVVESEKANILETPIETISDTEALEVLESV